MSSSNISVVMATFNGSKYLSAQLDSILAQTLKPYEIIIIDDCSSDDTWDILQSYQRQYDFIKLYQNDKNMGCVKSFFTGLQYSTSDYIAFCDQDDLWLPNKLAVLTNSIGDNLLIFSGERLIDSNSNMIHGTLCANNCAGLSFFDYLLQNKVRGCCSMISRKILDYGYLEAFYIHDHYFALLASSLNKIQYIPNQLVLYRQHNDNVIGANKFPYDKFIAHSQIVADSYSLLLGLDVFKPESASIRLIRDYRQAIATGKFISWKNIYKLLFFPRGASLIIYYFLVGKVFGYKFSKKMYNFIHKLN